MLGPGGARSLDSRSLDVQDPSANEFLAHPDFRQIAAFFLGWVFMSSLSCILYSSIVQNLLHRFLFRILTLSGVQSSDPELASPISEKPPSTWTLGQGSRVFTNGDNHTLVFTLCLCFAFASVADFASLLTFDLNQGATACAFVVAWGDMAAQSARLVGLLVLSFELKQLGIKRWEIIVFWAWLGVAIAFVFVTTAISVGSTKFIQQLGTSLCYRKHFLPTSLVSSVIFFALEVYAAIRISLFIAPAFLQMKHRTGILKDNRLIRAISLIVLELLTIVPSAIFTGTLGEFIPFSIGALGVLAAFNHNSTHAVEIRMDSIPPSLEISPPSRATTVRSLIVTTSRVPHSQIVLPPSPYHPAPILDHPYNRSSQSDPWRDMPNTSRSSRTIDTVTAKSIKDAVIQVASKGSRAPLSMVPPFPPSTQHSNRTTRTREANESNDVTPQQSPRQMQILPNQVQYAEQFDLEEPKKRRPPMIDTNSPKLTTYPSAAPNSSKAEAFRGSVMYGSDVLRRSRQGGDIPRIRPTSSDSTTENSRPSQATSDFTTSPRETLLSSPGRSTRRYSWASIVPPNEDVPHLPDGYRTLSRAPTFGEQAFQAMALPQLPPPAQSSRTSETTPQVLPRPRAVIRGPRPPPTSPFGFDRSHLIPLPSNPRERYRHSRSESMPTSKASSRSASPDHRRVGERF